MSKLNLNVIGKDDLLVGTHDIETIQSDDDRLVTEQSNTDRELQKLMNIDKINEKQLQNQEIIDQNDYNFINSPNNKENNIKQEELDKNKDFNQIIDIIDIKLEDTQDLQNKNFQDINQLISKISNITEKVKNIEQIYQQTSNNNTNIQRNNSQQRKIKSISTHGYSNPSSYTTPKKNLLKNRFQNYNTDTSNTSQPKNFINLNKNKYIFQTQQSNSSLEPIDLDQEIGSSENLKSLYKVPKHHQVTQNKMSLATKKRLEKKLKSENSKNPNKNNSSSKNNKTQINSSNNNSNIKEFIQKSQQKLKQNQKINNSTINFSTLKEEEQLISGRDRYQPDTCYKELISYRQSTKNSNQQSIYTQNSQNSSVSYQQFGSYHSQNLSFSGSQTRNLNSMQNQNENIKVCGFDTTNNKFYDKLQYSNGNNSSNTKKNKQKYHDSSEFLGKIEQINEEELISSYRNDTEENQEDLGYQSENNNMHPVQRKYKNMLKMHFKEEKAITQSQQQYISIDNQIQNNQEITREQEQQIKDQFQQQNQIQSNEKPKKKERIKLRDRPGFGIKAKSSKNEEKLNTDKYLIKKFQTQESEDENDQSQIKISNQYLIEDHSFY